jgi:two-component system, cell cycle sensor histidine kinase and response regulator CckA
MTKKAVPARGTVLIVEDEGNVRLLLTGVLQSAGFSVVAAFDGVDALKVCSEHSGPIKLMITDFMMPRMNGGELIRRASKLRPGMKSLCISGNAVDVAESQTVAVLRKPFTLTEILAKVTELLEVPPTCPNH